MRQGSILLATLVVACGAPDDSDDRSLSPVGIYETQHGMDAPWRVPLRMTTIDKRLELLQDGSLRMETTRHPYDLSPTVTAGTWTLGDDALVLTFTEGELFEWRVDGTGKMQPVKRVFRVEYDGTVIAMPVDERNKDGPSIPLKRVK